VRPHAEPTRAAIPTSSTEPGPGRPSIKLRLSRPERFAKVHNQLDPVFCDQTAGGTTMRVWVGMSTLANTNPQTATAQRPLGWCFAAEEDLAEALGLSTGTVRDHLNRLREADLLLLWRERDRSKGRAREFIVVPLANQEVVQDARRRQAEIERSARERRAARETAASAPRSDPRRSPNGRFSRGGGAPVDTVDATETPAVVATTVPTGLTTTAGVRDKETLGLDLPVGDLLGGSGSWSAPPRVRHPSRSPSRADTPQRRSRR